MTATRTAPLEGAALANSSTAGTNVPSANTKSQIAFTSAANADGSGAYILGVQSSGSTANILTSTNKLAGLRHRLRRRHVRRLAQPGPRVRVLAEHRPVHHYAPALTGPLGTA